jgi:hypothetical protein
VGSSSEREPSRWPGQMITRESPADMQQDRADSCGTPVLHSSRSDASGDPVSDSVAQQDNFSSSAASQGITLYVPAPPVANRPRTRLQDNIVKKKVFTYCTVRYDRLGLMSTCESKIIHEALDSNEWKNAMDVEFSALMNNKT